MFSEGPKRVISEYRIFLTKGIVQRNMPTGNIHVKLCSLKSTGRVELRDAH
jgi:hypothetical protein